MPMQVAANQIALGEKLYLFTSPRANTTSCLIWGHGGLLFGDGTYNLPAGVTLDFYVAAGEIHETQPGKAIRGPQLGKDVLASARLTGPAVISNYRMRKALGKGFEPYFVSYADVQKHMNASHAFVQNANGTWCPHVVSIRRRLNLHGKSMLLGEIIDAVLAHDPQITTFYYGGCRGDYSQKPIRSALLRARILFTK